MVNRWLLKKKREHRRTYYRNEYLKSDDWKRKRYVVLKGDNWRCVYCGAPATQVYHKRYANGTSEGCPSNGSFLCAVHVTNLCIIDISSEEQKN